MEFRTSGDQYIPKGERSCTDLIQHSRELCMFRKCSHRPCTSDLSSLSFPSMQDRSVSSPIPFDTYHRFSDDSSHEEEYPILSSHEKPDIPFPFSSCLRRRYLILGCIGFVLTSTLTYFSLSMSRTTPPEPMRKSEVVDYSNPKIDLLSHSLYLNGPPTAGFRGMRLAEARGCRL